MRKIGSIVLAMLVVVSAGACTGSKNECTPNAQQQCRCPDGTQGVQLCQSDGTWGPCQCSGQ